MTTPTSSGGIIHPPHSLEHLLTARRQLTIPMVDRAKYHRFLEQRMAYYISLQPSINATADRLHAIVDSASAPTNPRTAPAGSPRVPPPVNTCMSSSPLHHASPPQLMSGSPAATASRSRGGSTDYTVSAAAGASSGTAGAGIAYIRRQRTGSTASINSTATATGVHAAAGAGTGAGSGAGGGEGSTDGLVFNLSMTDLTAVGQQQQQQQLGTRRI